MFVIKYDRSNAAYLPGENITGRVIIVLSEKRSVQGKKKSLSRSKKRLCYF